MGDIVETADPRLRLRVEIAAHAPILRVDVLNGAETVDGAHGHAEAELGDRIRVTFHGAEYRGRGRQTTWKGTARFSEARIDRFFKISMTAKASEYSKGRRWLGKTIAASSAA